MADRSGKARADAADPLDAQRAELDRRRLAFEHAELERLQGELTTIRGIVREERAAHDAVFDEIRDASRVGQHVDAHSTDAWPRWQLANRNLETLLERLGTEPPA